LAAGRIAASVVALLAVASAAAPTTVHTRLTTSARIVAAPNTAADDRASFITDRRAAGHADRNRRQGADAPAQVPQATHPAAARTTRPATTARRADHSRHPARAVAVTVTAGHGRASDVIGFALAQVGKPYRWAAAGPGSYDCSGLVLAAYLRAGIRLPHQTGSMIGYGRPIARSELQPGDVVFPQRGHVAIYLGGGLIVHAPHPGDHVRVARLYAFYTARRLL
jgi:cell wall-associated NlpC family hydrolase